MCYKLHSGDTKWADEHLGNHGTFEPHLVEFEDDEYLVGINGRCGMYMVFGEISNLPQKDNLTINTNKQSYSFGTSKSGLPFTIHLPFNCVPVAFTGGFGIRIQDNNFYRRAFAQYWSCIFHF